MKLSHSKLDLILKCPASYFLNYKEGIKLKVEKPALSIGSAVHWGIEHNTENLEEFWNETLNIKKRDNYGYEQILSEAMVHGYLSQKEQIFNDILEEGKYKIIEDYHELTLTSKLGDNEFLGIIDLLILTDKGFIIEDYKTSSQKADWSKYLEQIYRYIYLVEANFPNIPVIKCGIINIVKSKIRQKKNETLEEFLIRLKREYQVDDGEYIEHHSYNKNELDMNLMGDYIKNLEKGAQLANLIDENENWYINYGKAIDMYGKSDYYDIFYNTEGNYLLYKIKDNIWDKDDSSFKDFRDCVDIDMLCLKEKNLLNKYEVFEKEINNYLNNNNKYDEKEITKYLTKKYKCNKFLLELYFMTFKEKNKK